MGRSLNASGATPTLANNSLVRMWVRLEYTRALFSTEEYTITVDGDPYSITIQTYHHRLESAAIQHGETVPADTFEWTEEGILYLQIGTVETEDGEVKVIDQTGEFDRIDHMPGSYLYAMETATSFPYQA